MNFYSLEQLVAVARSGSPFYRHLYARLPPQRPRLEELPVARFKSVMQAVHDDYRAFYTSEDAYGMGYTTSGTTGKPKATLFGRDEWRTVNQMLANMHWKNGTLRSGDVVCRLSEPGSASFMAIHRVVDLYPGRCSEIPIGCDTSYERIVATYQQFQANVPAGMNPTLLGLAAHLLAHGGPDPRVERLLGGGELLIGMQADLIREAFPNAQMCSFMYGAAEAGLIGYSEFGLAQNQFRPFPDHCAFEILDPITFAPIREPGVIGTAVVTSFVRLSTPVIRFMTGDFARWDTDPPAPLHGVRAAGSRGAPGPGQCPCGCCAHRHAAHRRSDLARRGTRRRGGAAIRPSCRTSARNSSIRCCASAMAPGCSPHRSSVESQISHVPMQYHSPMAHPLRGVGWVALADQLAHTRHDLSGETLLFRDHGKKRKQKGADASPMKLGNALGNLVVAADKARNRAAVRTDHPPFLVLEDVLDGLCFLVDLVGAPIQGPGKSVLHREPVRQLGFGFGFGFAYQRESGGTELQWLTLARASGHILDHRNNVLHRAAIDEPAVGIVARQLPPGFRFAPGIDEGPSARGRGRPQRERVQCERFTGVAHCFPCHEGTRHGDPFSAVCVALAMGRKTDTRALQLGTKPGADQIDGESALTDVFDAKRHFGKHRRVIETRLDSGDDLDARGDGRRRGRCGPCLQNIYFLALRIDGVLGKERRVEAAALGAQHDVARQRKRRGHFLGGRVRHPLSTMRRPDAKADRSGCARIFVAASLGHISFSVSPRLESRA